MVVAAFSCKEDDDTKINTNPGDTTKVGNISFVVTPTAPQGKPGDSVEITVAASSSNGLSSIQVGEVTKMYFNNEKSDNFVAKFPIPVSATVGSAIEVTVTVMDKGNKDNMATKKVSVSVVEDNIEILQSKIAANTTWKATKKYLLKGNVYVQSGVTLTIEPGTVIMGDKASKGSLIINRGAKIMAVGTPEKPIVFTSNQAPGARATGDWGGIVILGKAPSNNGSDNTIEGISAATGDDGRYGGNVADDNSGELKYVRIEFAGIALSPNNEINSLTLAGVGSGTKISYIQVSYAGDDSYEWFGGTVNCNHLVAFRGTDDEFDTDNGYSGYVQFAVGFRDPVKADFSLSNGFESDNDANGSTTAPLTSAKFANVSLFGPHATNYLNPKSDTTKGFQFGNMSADYQAGAHIRRKSDLRVYNSIFMGWTVGVNLEKSSANAISEFKGNYINRNKSAWTISAGLDTTGIGANNYVEGNAEGSWDVSAIFGGMKKKEKNGNVNKFSAYFIDLTSPNPVLAGGSKLLNAGKSLPAGWPNTDGFSSTANYVGAFDTNNWMTGWTNFDPQNTVY